MDFNRPLNGLIERNWREIKIQSSKLEQKKIFLEQKIYKSTRTYFLSPNFLINRLLLTKLLVIISYDSHSL